MRLLLPVGAALLAAMTIAWAIALSLLTGVINDQLDGRLENATTVLADGAFPFSKDLLQRLDGLIDARVALLDRDGQVQVATAGPAFTTALTAVGAENFPTDAGLTRFVGFDAGATAFRAAIRRLPADRDARFDYVVVAASLEASRAGARESALLLGAAMALAALVLVLIGSYFVHSITRPISRLADAANRIAEGERSIEVETRESNELGVLAQAFHDMATRLDDYEKELARTSRLSGLGDLAARVAHEIRNPLTAMKMQLEMLEERVSGRELNRVNRVLDEVKRLELIVENALAVGGASAVNPAPGDVAKLVDDVAELLRPALLHRGIDLEIDLPRLPVLPIDENRMKQVLLNLANNAADELKKGGVIRISAVARDRDVALHVDDSGPGVATSDEGSSKPLGLGLGLKISREIVEAHGGRLTHERSTQLGGARFTVTLPVSIMAEQPH